MVLDSEAHVLFECALHGAAREDLVMNLSTPAFEALGDATTSQSRLLALLGSTDKADFEHIDRFLCCVRQARRKAKRRFELMQQRIKTDSFGLRAAAWRLKGRFACSHVVLFRLPPHSDCKCMQHSFNHEIWTHAA